MSGGGEGIVLINFSPTELTFYGHPLYKITARVR